MAKDKQKHAGQQFKTMPTLDELRAMFPKDRKAYLDSLDPESRAALFQHICADLPEPATEEEVDAELFGVKDAFSVVRDLIRGNVYPNIGNDAELRKHFSSLPADKRVDAITKWDDVTMAYVTQRQRKMLKRLNEIGTNKKIAEIHKDVKETKAAAERAAEAAERTAELIRTLRPEWLTGEEKPPRSYIKTAGTIKIRIYDWWEEYKAQHDPEDNGGRQADYATFYYLNNGREIHTGVTLQELIEQQAETDEKKRTPEEIIRRIIKSERQRQRVAEKKQKTKAGQKRSKK